MGILLLCLILGVVLGWKRWLPQRILAWSGRAINLGVIFLLLTMGIKIGVDPETLSKIAGYGLQALIFGFLTVVVSLGLVWTLERWLFPTHMMIGFEILVPLFLGK